MTDFYCGGCESVLLLGDFDIDLSGMPERPKLPRGDYGRSDIPFWTAVEELFLQCPCGGRFRYLNPPKCPKCKGLLLGNCFEGKPALKQTEGYVFASGRIFYAKDMLAPAEQHRSRKHHQ